MRLLRTPIPQPPTPTLLKVMDFLKSLENSENLPDYRECSKHHEDYFLFEVVALLLLNFELGSYGVWGLWGESFYYKWLFATWVDVFTLASALPPKFNFINSFNSPR
jgi:hypothetical protein